MLTIVTDLPSLSSTQGEPGPRGMRTEALRVARVTKIAR